MRVTGPHLVFSLRSDVTPNSQQISGVSLAGISNLSVICLPIYRDELYNGDMYEDTRNLGLQGAGRSPI